MSFTLHEGNTIRLTAQGQDDNGINRDLDMSKQLDWAASSEGIVAVSPVAGTLFADLSYVGAGTVTITATGVNLAGTTVTGTIGGTTVAKPVPPATHIVVTAGPEVPIP